jgi:uncharacterized protein (DUF2267 family)
MIFDKTVQKTEEWLKELSLEMGWDNKQMAYDGLRAVLHALRDRLTVEAAVKFGAQLPMLVRGFYYEGWVPSLTPIKIHSKEQFIDLTKEHIRHTNVQLENIEFLIYNVFHLLKKHINEEEIAKLKLMLPKPLVHFFEEIKV